MLSEAAEASSDRLSRASRLAEHLRNNPKDVRRDPEDLARQFDVPVSVAEYLLSSQLQEQRRFSKAKPHATRGLWKLAAARSDQAIERLTSNPYLYLAITGFALLVLTQIEWHTTRSWPVQLAFALLWILSQLVLLAKKPLFRFAVWGSVVVAIDTFLLLAFDARKSEATIALPVMLLLIWMVACMIGIVYAGLGGLGVLVSGIVRVSEERRQRAALSRHQLLGRMFELQALLESTPQSSVPKKTRLWGSFRRHPFLWTSTLFFGLSMIAAVDMLAFKVDPLHSQRLVQHPVGILITFLVAFSILLLTITFSFAANTWKRTLDVLLGLTVGDVLSTLADFVFLAVPRNEYGTYWISVASGTVVRCALVGAIRFGIYLQRELARMKETQQDESAILAELLEIRHRLMSNPVNVCVLVVDVVGSTRMKRGADALDAEYSFRSYQSWIAEAVSRNGGKVDATAGDSAIAAFATAEAALNTAKELQGDLDRLNKQFNRLASPFRLRTALHLGTVTADLDKVQFTHVIDVAAHVEKASPVGGVAATEPAWEALGRPEAMQPLAHRVDGFPVYALHTC